MYTNVSETFDYEYKQCYLNSWNYHSSPMNWCEEKYTHSEYIVEFWNSISSLFFTLFAILGYFIHRNYKTYDSKFNMLLQWSLFGLIGLTSFWFHSTLSFLGQFADEFNIILYLIFSIKQMFHLHNYIFYITTLLLSLVSWFYPFMSPFFLLIFGTILVWLTKISLNTGGEVKLWNRGFNFGILSIILWILDFVCIMNTHTWWHIFITYSSYCYTLVMLKLISKKYCKIEFGVIPYLTN